MLQGVSNLYNQTNACLSRRNSISSLQRTYPALCATEGASESSTHICMGDSGGPLIIYDEPTKQEVIIGIVLGAAISGPSVEKCGAGRVLLYTDVSLFASWINRTFLFV